MSTWKLYWVASDGYEDCFVVAKNSRSAARIEVSTNGFEYSDLRATRIMDIPDAFEKKANTLYRKWFKEHGRNQTRQKELRAWPGYAENWLLTALGARFRDIDETSQILLNGTVYSCNASGQWNTYSIGAKAICERNPELPKPDFAEEEHIDCTEYLHKALGIALLRCHEIEWLLSKSFIFAFSEKQKRKYETLHDFFCGWEKKHLAESLQPCKSLLT